MVVEKPKFSPLRSYSLKTNTIANLAGTCWQALMGLIFVPLYVKFMGIESYGLVGIFVALQGIFGLLDIGLGDTLTREMARLSVLPEKEQETRNLVRTLEILYWGIAAFVGIVIAALSRFIAHYWIKAEHFTPQTLEHLLLMMGLITVFQMPMGFYSGGLIGLQKQVLLNTINICMGTLRGAGAVLILWLVSPSIRAFLLWQLAVSVINALLLALFIWRSLPQSKNRSLFQFRLIKSLWKFTAGMAGISLLSVILTQLDKVILSKLLSLEMFGYYSLASLVAMSLTRIFTPVFFSIYPVFTQLASLNDLNGLKRRYHQSCQLIAILVLPVAVLVALFSYESILLWTRNPMTAERTHTIVSIMICGTALNGLMNPPYALQLAFGWTRLSVIKNIVALVLFVPLIIVLTLRYGAVGAASAWLALNIGYLIFEIPVMHAKLLPSEMWRWYWNDVSIPIMAALSVAVIGRLLLSGATSQSMMILYLFVIAVVTLGTTVASVPMIRSRVYEQLFG